MFSIFTIISALPLAVFSLSPPSSRTTPPTGAFIVRSGTTSSSEYASLTEAVAALPSGTSAVTIFMYPGTYSEQVDITRAAVTIMGYTEDPGSYTSNQVTITAGESAGTAGSDDASGTLRLHADDIALYNIDIKNTFGSGSQAIALSNYGNQVGVYACGLYGYQDTLLAEQGLQVYLQSYIEGAVDFIFGQTAQGYFEGNTLAVSGTGCITASGRDEDNDAIYLFNHNTIIKASDATTIDYTYLGRPWSDFAQVIFLNTEVETALEAALWMEWSSSEPNTDHVVFADYNTTGSGVPSSLDRPSWATALTSSEAADYTLSSALGTTSWVDSDYLM
ncbi:carbohydrate esterase family 8 protein [Stereum hirsutum FP-91666 SS1]|uniref:carbohydrate esterase family 8 protein n=1 Tax=Stereum hirsutum (strain FP-91666) TaxID=721885 RepID=UPI0004449825|nr:carbohydrate esterase family 8 protein [Stereum hirsutum FP-91666 SS1]EIM83832.1 carbohydrate esterase family 8 protein [Stereum hirsutum FP-91666 SS1]